MNYATIRNQYKAALRDRNPQRFFDEFSYGFEKKQIRPSDFSFRKLFESLVEDGSEIVQSWQPGGTPVLLTEVNARTPHALLEAGATVTSAFANISGQIVYNAVMDAYKDEQYVFTPLVQTVPTIFNGERIPGVTRLGDTFEAIGENQPYPIAGVGEDYIDTPQTQKRGEIVAVSKEAIFFDRTGLIMERCQEAGHFYGANKEKRIIDAVIDENVTRHRHKWKGTVYASFYASGDSGPWINKQGSSALVDWTDIDSAELLMSQLIDPHTGEPILITPKHLVCTRQLKATARQIVTATEVRKGDGSTSSAVTIGLSPIDTNYQIVSSALLAQRMATDTDWFIGDIGAAVKYMENWPMKVDPAPLNSEAEFTQDVAYRWKVSEMGAAAVVQPRALVKNTVS